MGRVSETVQQPQPHHYQYQPNSPYNRFVVESWNAKTSQSNSTSLQPSDPSTPGSELSSSVTLYLYCLRFKPLGGACS
uniref:Uncharacterized protein n=1 Tax=Trichogramma kaykai TaxID=54128 RepID=A0ABD2WGV6_9HYME